ncbi:hypothetical protein ACH5RR_021450 [Cinchona calisaya]|uniref:Uncharacterized protein n=1 Tax=Cinchona calisaya TaxID=153742 RepID=A0ABD2ZJ44_9GENT
MMRFIISERERPLVLCFLAMYSSCVTKELDARWEALMTYFGIDTKPFPPLMPYTWFDARDVVGYAEIDNEATDVDT